jgi:hypothetical protein
MFQVYSISFYKIDKFILSYFAWYRFQLTLHHDRKKSYLTKYKEITTEGPQPVNNLKNYAVKTAAIIALVLAIAGIIFLATPKVSISVTPSMLYFFALSSEFS